jgi:anthranilate synthase/aminodeoxychorismate synthase-like glutamine amidotransferase
VILVIDNYDSFTFNLVRYFEELGQVVEVVKNDQITLPALRAKEFSHLVISPGPCTPNESGICLDAIKSIAGEKPILGVCLGHQAIAQVFGATIKRAKHIRHGKTSTLHVVNKANRLFANCPDVFEVTRYHSLIVDELTLPPDFNVSAISNTEQEREVMAFENTALRLYGLQFHPESLLTEYGHQVLENFLIKG